MADNHLTVWAAADLDPISPSPLHPSSPVVVPTLQSQVDHDHGSGAANVNKQSEVAAVISTDTQRTIQGQNPVDEAEDQEEQIASDSDSDYQPFISNETLKSIQKSTQNGQYDGQYSQYDDHAEDHRAGDGNAELGHAELGFAKVGCADDGLAKDCQTVSATEIANAASMQLPRYPNKYLPTASSCYYYSTSQTGHMTAGVGNQEPARNLANNQSASATNGQTSFETITDAIAAMDDSVHNSDPTCALNGYTAPRTLILPAKPSASGFPYPAGHGSLGKQEYDKFLEDERKYVQGGNWDKFPDGTRLFVGNLSSDRVTKSEAFELFSKYGHLIQISLKPTYSFVQYYTVAGSQAAMDALQGIEVRGKKINLEVSRRQKKNEGHRLNNKYRDRDRHDPDDSNRGQSDDYRPGRHVSPQHGTHRQPSHDKNTSNRAYRKRRYSQDRRRSVSPDYRRRNSHRYQSHSPHRQHPTTANRELPHRNGADVPDVVFLIVQKVNSEFISWLQNLFVGQGLRVEVMFLSPQLARDVVIQHQVLRGIHAAVDLDFRAQERAKVSIQVFDRSAGHDSARFDQYRDIDPNIAAQLVIRTISQSKTPTPYYGGSSNSGNNQHYFTTQHPHTLPHIQPLPNQPYSPANAPGAVGSQLDAASIKKILDTLSGQQAMTQPYLPQAGGTTVDANGMLGSMGNTARGLRIFPHPASEPPAPAAALQGMNPMHNQHNVSAADANPGNASAQHVRNIMAQLARYNQ